MVRKISECKVWNSGIGWSFEENKNLLEIQFLNYHHLKYQLLRRQTFFYKKFVITTYLFGRELLKYHTYFEVPNKRPGPNKHPGGKILRNQ